MDKKKESTLPPFLDPNLLRVVIGLRERNTTEKDKFQNLESQNYKKLIKPSVEVIKKTSSSSRKLSKHDTFRERLNKQLKQIALFALKEKQFTKDVISLAKKYGLHKRKYLIYSTDFYEYKNHPALNSFESRLKLTFLMITSKDPRVKIEKRYLPEIFEKDVLYLMKKYGLEFYWYESVAGLIVSGEWYLPRHSSVVVVELYDETGVLSPQISIKVSKNTTQAEIETRWGLEIEPLKEEMYFNYKKKNKTIEDLEEVLFHAETFGGRCEIAEDEKSKIKRSVSNKNLKKSHDRALKEQQLSSKKTIKIPPIQILNELLALKKPTRSIYFF